MNEHCGPKTTHTKTRGKIHKCYWCGQRIIIGEKYDKWLYYDARERSTVYAHKECADEWEKEARLEGGIVYAYDDMERPNKKETQCSTNT